jgi:hypothetical protein
VEASGHVDGGAIAQRHHGADTRGRHQAPAHPIIPDDSQQTAMQDDDLFAEHPPDNEQRFDQCRQVREVLDQLFDAGLKRSTQNLQLSTSYRPITLSTSNRCHQATR